MLYFFGGLLKIENILDDNNNTVTIEVTGFLNLCDYFSIYQFSKTLIATKKKEHGLCDN